ncbi:MAG: lipid-A-disaccharide synthase [Cyanobacteria bacterium J06648_16]
MVKAATDSAIDDSAIDIVILSNGPGEISTWVKPIVQALKAHPTGPRQRISVLLSPCPHASGNEHVTALSYPEVDRVQAAVHFFRFLLTGQTANGWDWYERGVVVFLGGDQLYPVLVGKRLGYPPVIYAEWEGRWQSWIHAYGAMQSRVVEKASPKYRDKFTIVGDLMADVSGSQDRTAIESRLGIGPETELVGLMPGSKPLKLKMGVPLVSAIATYLHPIRPNLHFVIPVAPTLDIKALASYTDPVQNSFVRVFDGPRLELIIPSESGLLPYLQTDNGTRMYLWKPFPAFDLLSRCQLCITTAGANTAQLGALAVPMIVLLPARQIAQEFDYLDGLPSLVSKLPGIGPAARSLINGVVLRVLMRQGKYFSWPNIWAQRAIVPELLDHLSGESVGNRVLDYLEHPERLRQVSDQLRQLRGPSGAAEKMADLIMEAVS